MGKDSGMMKLFASKGTRSQSPARETAAEMERRALSPILVKARNKVPAHPQHGHSNIVHPTSQALKKIPSLVNQKSHSGEYVENVTTVSPGTPEHKLSAPSTPKSATKKKFGWNVTRQPHEDSTHGSYLYSSQSLFVVVPLCCSAIVSIPSHIFLILVTQQIILDLELR